MGYTTVKKVQALNAHPRTGVPNSKQAVVDEEDVKQWDQLRSSELDLVMKLKGIEVPITDPPELVDVLELAATYGVAAMLEGAPRTVLQNGTEINIYLQEFVRLKTWLEARTREELIGGGLLESTVVVPVPPGLSLARNANIRSDPSPWYDHYPVRRADFTS